jgi:hypothetical protein
MYILVNIKLHVLANHGHHQVWPYLLRFHYVNALRCGDLNINRCYVVSICYRWKESEEIKNYIYHSGDARVMKTTTEMRFQKYWTLILSKSQILHSTLITPKIAIHIGIFMFSSKSECWVIYLMTLSVAKIIVSVVHEQAWSIGWIMQQETEVIRETTVPVPLCPP